MKEIEKTVTVRVLKFTLFVVLFLILVGANYYFSLEFGIWAFLSAFKFQWLPVLVAFLEVSYIYLLIDIFIFDKNSRVKELEEEFKEDLPYEYGNLLGKRVKYPR